MFNWIFEKKNHNNHDCNLKLISYKDLIYQGIPIYILQWFLNDPKIYWYKAKLIKTK